MLIAPFYDRVQAQLPGGYAGCDGQGWSQYADAHQQLLRRLLLQVDRAMSDFEVALTAAIIIELIGSPIAIRREIEFQVTRCIGGAGLEAASFA